VLDVAGFIPGIGIVADAISAIDYALEGDWVNASISAASVFGADWLKAGRLARRVVQEVVEGSAEQVAKNALQEQGKKVRTSGNNPYAQGGREIHKQFEEEAKAKGWEIEREDTRLKDRDTGRYIYPDAIDECGRPVELKPDTPSGRRRARKQGEKYQRASGKDPVIIYYDPKTGRILYP
jgi:hypothetical protein